MNSDAEWDQWNRLIDEMLRYNPLKKDPVASECADLLKQEARKYVLDHNPFDHLHQQIFENNPLDDLMISGMLTL